MFPQKHHIVFRLRKYFCILFLFTTSWANGAVNFSDLAGAPLFRSIEGPKDFFVGGNAIITAFVQDKNGFIWFGTQSGLTRYDGFRFKHYSHKSSDSHSISENYVRSLWLSPDGHIWVGTNSGGISIYIPDEDRFHRLVFDGQETGFAHTRVQTIISDQQGGVWIGSDNGLYHLPKGMKHISRYGGPTDENGILESQSIRSILKDQSGTLWVGSLRGLYKLDPMKKKLEKFKPKLETDLPFEDEEIWQLYEDNNKRLWWGGRKLGGGWIDINRDSLHFLTKNKTDFSFPWVSAIKEVVPGEIWFATYGGGINAFNADTAELIKQYRHDSALSDTLSLDTLGSMFKDKSGLLWIGTWGAGINILDTTNVAFRTIRHSPNIPESLSYANVFSVLERGNGDIWVGTHGNGIDVLDTHGVRKGGYRPDPTKAGTLTDGAILSMTEGENGHIWVGTRQGGLHEFNPETNQFRQFTINDGLPHMQINRLLFDQGGVLWIATGMGLASYHPTLNKFKTYSKKNSDQSRLQREVQPLAILDDGSIWAGTDHGLLVLPYGAEELLQFQHSETQADGLSNSDINGLVVHKNGTLWIAHVQGIDRLLEWDGKNARFENINSYLKEQRAKPRLLSNMVEDGLGRIWDLVGFLDPHHWEYNKLTTADGVDVGGGWVGAYTALRDGRMLFGGATGLLIIYPENYEGWEYMPDLVVSNLRIDGKNQILKSNTQLTLSPDTKSFSIEFSSLDYSSMDETRYQYMLEGYESNWIETAPERREATYTNLDPGNYVFHVKGSNRRNIWSTNEIELAITIQPKYFQTAWFRAIVLVFIAFISLVLFQWRLKVILRQQRDKQEKHEAIQKAELMLDLMEQKNKMLAEVTHDLRTPLSAIKLQLEALEDGAIEHSEKFYSSLQNKLGNLNKMVGDLDHLSVVEVGTLTLHKSDINLNEILSDAIETFLPLAEKNNILISHDIESTSAINIHADPGRLTQVFNNVLKNSIRYTDPQGRIVISTSIEEIGASCIVINFEDSSPGVAENELEQLFTRLFRADATRNRSVDGAGLGLFIVDSIIKTHDGMVSVEHSELGGLQLQIKLPIV